MKMTARFVVMCPKCGFFMRHLTILNACELIGEHTTPTILREDEYYEMVDELLSAADEALDGMWW